MDVDNKEVKKIRTNVNGPELAEDLSLWTIIGQKRIVEILKNIVLAYFADKEIGRNPQYFSVLISGEPGSGRRTIGKALVNSLGCTNVRECLGKTLAMGGESIDDYFEPQEDLVLFVNGGQSLSRFAQETFHKLLTTNAIYIPDRITCTRRDVVFETKPLVIFTVEKALGLFPELYNVFDLHLFIKDYSTPEIFLILKQRCQYCVWRYSSDEVLEIIADNSNGNPGQSMKLLQMAYSISRSQDRNILEIKDAEKAVELFVKKDPKVGRCCLP